MYKDMDQNYVIILFILICRIYELSFQGLRNEYNMNIVENSSYFHLQKYIGLYPDLCMITTREAELIC